MAAKWQNVGCCKSFSLCGIDGAELVVSETIDRTAIEISVRKNGDHITGALSVRLNAEQFNALCGMNSPYDGLEVKHAEPAEIAEEPEDGPDQRQPVL